MISGIGLRKTLNWSWETYFYCMQEIEDVLQSSKLATTRLEFEV